MIEMFLCSLVTILPDFLVRRFVQGKKLGREITIYSIWFELRYGITACLVLTICLFTLILYSTPRHPARYHFIAPSPFSPRAGGVWTRST